MSVKEKELREERKRKRNIKKTGDEESSRRRRKRPIFGKCLKVRAAQLAASGELAGQLQCLICHVFASTHEILQVNDFFVRPPAP